MNPIIAKTENRKTVYLSARGEWIKSKRNARVFGSVQEARDEAAKRGARVEFYTFRNF